MAREVKGNGRLKTGTRKREFRIEMFRGDISVSLMQGLGLGARSTERDSLK